MNEANLTEALARVIEDGTDRRWFDFGRDPEVAEEIGRTIAEQIREDVPDVVLCLEHEEDAVLAHVIARRLGATRVVLREQEGLLWFSHELPKGSSVVAISVDPGREKPREVLFEMLSSHNARLTYLVRLTPDQTTTPDEWVIRNAQ